MWRFGHDHQVAVVVRELVEDDEAGDAAEDDERGLLACQRLAEDAAGLATAASRMAASRGTRGDPCNAECCVR